MNVLVLVLGMISSSESESGAAVCAAGVPWGWRTMVSPSVAGWCLLERLGGMPATEMLERVPTVVGKRKKMD